MLLNFLGGEFNRYKSKHLASKLYKSRSEVFQTRKNIAIAEDFRIASLHEHNTRM